MIYLLGKYPIFLPITSIWYYFICCILERWVNSISTTSQLISLDCGVLQCRCIFKPKHLSNEPRPLYGRDAQVDDEHEPREGVKTIIEDWCHVVCRKEKKGGFVDRKKMSDG